MFVVINMISREENPYFLNDFLDYSATILNKSSNTIKEYNYDISHFLKFIAKSMCRKKSKKQNKKCSKQSTAVSDILEKSKKIFLHWKSHILE